MLMIPLSAVTTLIKCKMVQQSKNTIGEERSIAPNIAFTVACINMGWNGTDVTIPLRLL